MVDKNFTVDGEEPGESNNRFTSYQLAKIIPPDATCRGDYISQADVDISYCDMNRFAHHRTGLNQVILVAFKGRDGRVTQPDVPLLLTVRFGQHPPVKPICWLNRITILQQRSL